jgi:hypothetical protein
VSATQLRSSCDIAKSYLASNMISYRNMQIPFGDIAYVTVGDARVSSFDGGYQTKADRMKAETEFRTSMDAVLTSAGYPSHASLATRAYIGLVALMAFLLSLYAAIYSPAGAWMTELFPSRLRYTAISLPYNIGAGWFGGFMPATAFSMVAANGDIYYGLWYPVIILALTTCAGFFLLPETSGRQFETTQNEGHAGSKDFSAESPRYDALEN